MLFPTVTFALFFLVVYAGNWLLHNRPAAWKWFMLAASYVFYGYWDWRFLGLIGASSVLNHGLAVWMAHTSRPRARRALVATAVALNLALLGFFKYYGFFVVNAYALCAHLGIPCSLPLLDVVLPVGISFFTFQAMSYVLDVYRGEIQPAESVLDFSVYLAFFPQLVAGPIVRASILLPQVAHPRLPTRLDVGRAAILILGGLFKKIVIANLLATHLVDAVFDNPEMYGGWDTLAAVYGYCVQIYCDFSGYSDIAIGIALLLGFHFPINFDAPYLSTSVQEFWRRWHISLSTWLRDYLYIPLGGSRGSPARTSLNLFLTFLLGGLWHGAGWNFVIWGALHGAYLTVGRFFRRSPATFGPLGRLWRMALTFHLVGFTLLFFRARTFTDTGLIFRAFAHWPRPDLVTVPVIAAIAIGLATQLLDGARPKRLWDAWAQWPAWVQGAVTAVLLTIICGLGPRGVAPFIYFQF